MQDTNETIDADEPSEPSHDRPQTAEISAREGQWFVTWFKSARANVVVVTLYVISVAALLTASAACFNSGKYNASVLLMVFVIPLVPFLPFNLIPWLRRRAERIARTEGDAARGYFTTAPRDDDTFGLFSKGYEEFLKWLVETRRPLLYLTGVSGAGKSSLIGAYLRPQLSKGSPDSDTGVIVLRNYVDSLSELKNELLRFWKKRPDDYENLTAFEALQRAARQMQCKKLLIVFDQFEELFLLTEVARDFKSSTRDLEEVDLATVISGPVIEIKDFLDNVVTTTLSGVTVLLSYRDDHHRLISELKLPAREERVNWMVLDPLDFSTAKKFLNSCPGLQIPPERMLLVLREAASQEGSQLVMRPIVANLMGTILQKMSDHPTLWKQKNELLQHYVRNTIRGRGESQEDRSAILRSLVSAFHTSRPCSTSQLSDETRLKPTAIGSHLSELTHFGLVRCLNPSEPDRNRIWQIPHDFLANLIERVLDGMRGSFWRMARPFIAPVAFSAAVIASFLSFHFRNTQLENMRHVAEQCLAIEGSPLPSRAEVRKWDQLSTLSDDARLHALVFGLRNQPANIKRRADWVTHAVFGFDPDGSLRRSFVGSAVDELLGAEQTSYDTVDATLNVIEWLSSRTPTKPGEKQKTATICKAIKRSIDAVAPSPSKSRRIYELGYIISNLGDNISVADSEVLASAISKHMTAIQTSEYESSLISEQTAALGFALSSIRQAFSPKYKITASELLTRRIEREQAFFNLTLQEVDTTDSTRLYKQHPELLRQHLSYTVLYKLCTSLERCTESLPSKEVAPYSLRITRRLFEEKDFVAILALAECVKALAMRIDAEAAASVLDTLKHGILIDRKFESFLPHAILLASYGSLYQQSDIAEISEAFLKYFIEQTDPELCTILVNCIEVFHERLGAEFLQRISRALLSKMEGQNSEYIALLAASVMRMIEEDQRIDSKVIESIWSKIIVQMAGEIRNESFVKLVKVLVRFPGVSRKSEVQSVLHSVSQRVCAAGDSGDVKTLVSSLKDIWFVYEPTDAEALVLHIIKRIMREKREQDLLELSEAVRVLLETCPQIDADRLQLILWRSRLSDEVGDEAESPDKPFSVSNSLLYTKRIAYALSCFGGRCDRNVAVQCAELIRGKMSMMTDAETYAESVRAWLRLEPIVFKDEVVSLRIKACLDIVDRPIGVLSLQDVLSHLEKIKDAGIPEMEGDVWRLVEWICAHDADQSLQTIMKAYRPSKVLTITGN